MYCFLINYLERLFSKTFKYLVLLILLWVYKYNDTIKLRLYYNIYGYYILCKIFVQQSELCCCFY